MVKVVKPGSFFDDIMTSHPYLQEATESGKTCVLAGLTAPTVALNLFAQIRHFQI